MVVCPSQLTKFCKREIDELFESAAPVYRSKSLTVLVARAKKDFGRLLLIIPRQVGSAPMRNRLRRRTKAIFYQERFYEYKKDIIFITRKSAAKLRFEEITKLLKHAVTTKQ